MSEVEAAAAESDEADDERLTQALAAIRQQAKELLKRETEQAAEALRKAAEKTVPGFQTVEDMAQKARDWWNS